MLHYCFSAASHPENYSYGDPSKDGKKKIIVCGTIEQIEIALGLIEEKIRLEDGFDVDVPHDFSPVKVPGAYAKILSDELPDDPRLRKIILSPLPAGT